MNTPESIRLKRILDRTGVEYDTIPPLPVKEGVDAPGVDIIFREYRGRQVLLDGLHRKRILRAAGAFGKPDNYREGTFGLDYTTGKDYRTFEMPRGYRITLVDPDVVIEPVPEVAQAPLAQA